MEENIIEGGNRVKNVRPTSNKGPRADNGPYEETKKKADNREKSVHTMNFRIEYEKVKTRKNTFSTVTFLNFFFFLCGTFLKVYFYCETPKWLQQYGINATF